MLQFNKSEATNTNAVWIDSVNTGSGYYDSLVFVYSQSLDNSNGLLDVDTISAPNSTRNWLIIRNSGSAVPTPSGQYDFKLYLKEEIAAIWNQVAVAWDSYDEVWSTAGDSLPTTLLYEDRAYVSGSNEPSFVSYVSSNEDGAYKTFNS